MLRARAVHVVSKQSDATEFVARLNAMAAERELRWYKGNKDVTRSIRHWLSGEIQVYYWVLDVIELVVIEMEQAQRRRLQSIVDTELEPGQAVTSAELNKRPTRTIEAGTVAELDALREIVFLFHPLSPEARQRTLHYLESL